MAKKKDILDKGAILQRDGERYALTPRIPCGLIEDFALLRRIADVAERFDAQAIKVTSSQRLAIIGVREEDIDAIWAALGTRPGYALGMCVRSVKACPGTRYCRMGLQDATGLGLRLEERFDSLPMPNKLKISVSGCPLDCAEAQVRDIGLVGGRRGFSLLLGGSVGARPRLGDEVARRLPPDEAEETVARVIERYRSLGKKRRIGRVIEQIGLEAFIAPLGLQRDG